MRKKFGIPQFAGSCWCWWDFCRLFDFWLEASGEWSKLWHQQHKNHHHGCYVVMKPSHWNSVTWRLKLHWLWMVPMTWLVFEHFHDSTIQLLLLRHRRCWLLSTSKEAASRRKNNGRVVPNSQMDATHGFFYNLAKKGKLIWKWTSKIPTGSSQKRKMDWENAHQNIYKTYIGPKTTVKLLLLW